MRMLYLCMNMYVLILCDNKCVCLTYIKFFPLLLTLLLQLGLHGLYFISVITDYCFMFFLYA